MQEQVQQVVYEPKRSRIFFAIVVIIFMLSFNVLSYFIISQKLYSENQVTGNFIYVFSNSGLSGLLSFLNIVFLGIFRFIYYIWTDRPKKGQAAMEFIMTYGWVILVVTIFIVSLFYINYVNVQKSPSTQGCFLFTGLSCEEHKIDTTSVFIVVRNGLGEDLSYLNIVVVGSDNYCANTSLNLSGIFSDGSLIKLNKSCLNTPPANSLFRSDLDIYYRIAGKSITHRERGYIMTKVEQTIAVTNGTCSDGTPINSCSLTKPRYCNGAGQIIDNCNICSCNDGLLCNSGSGSCYSTNYCPDGTQYQACSVTKPVYCTSSGAFVSDCNVCGCPSGYSNCQSGTNKCYDILSNGTRLYITNTFSDVFPSKTLVYTNTDLNSKTVYLNISKNTSFVSAIMNVAGEKLILFRTNALSENFVSGTWVSLDSYKVGVTVLQNGTLRGYGFNGNSTFNSSTLYSSACSNAVFSTGLKTPQNHDIYYQEIASGSYVFIDVNNDGVCASDPVYRLGFGESTAAVLTQGGVEPYTSGNQETSSYPSSVKIDLGNNGSDEFSKTGIYSSTEQFDFKSALLSYLSSSCSSSTCSVPFVVKSTTSGRVTLKDISVTYYGS